MTRIDKQATHHVMSNVLESFDCYYLIALSNNSDATVSERGIAAPLFTGADSYSNSDDMALHDLFCSCLQGKGLLSYNRRDAYCHGSVVLRAVQVLFQRP